MPTLTIDNPHVRNARLCPLCDGDKAQGLVACWPCYNTHGLRYGNAIAESRIAARERHLTNLAHRGQRYGNPAADPARRPVRVFGVTYP